LQAIRGVLRYGGTAAPCAAGAYNDHDDLVFAVRTDGVPPTAALTAPAPDAVLAGTATLTALATDDVAVARVDFYEGSTLIGSDSAPPYSVTWSTAALPNGSYSLTARAVDLAGNTAPSLAVPVSVLNTVLPEVAAAVYDPILKAPKCAANAIGCTTGTLVNGRGPVGPEPSQPNTIHGSCADGTSGTFHTDESIDELTITTLDGSGLAPEKEAKIEAKVWVYSDSDRLDLYFAPNALTPAWTFITTLSPTGSGLATLTATYTIPAGGTLQAIRGVFRYGGSAAPCAPGSYSDHDDLIFATIP
jgi:hypothetical protein